MTFTGFAAPALVDNLELDVNDDGGADSIDDKTVQIVAGPIPNISSAANQWFFFADPATAINAITVADAAIPVITAANDLRIRIPGPLVMTWDTSDTAVTLGGPAAAKVSGTVAYEDGDKTLVLDVTSDFVIDDYITISDLSFTNFDQSSGPDNLELEVANDDVVTATDDKTTMVRGPRLASAVDQVFVVGDPVTTAALITITDDIIGKSIQKKLDVRIRIPAGFNMEWDPAVTTITLGGPYAGNVSTLLLAYEDGNKTAVIDVTKNLNAGGQFTIDDLRFTNFTAVSGPDNLELEVNDDGVVSGLDAQTIAIVQPTISSASNQFFTIGDPITPVSTITGADGVLAAAIDTANDIRIRIPATFNMTWDTTDTTATLGGSASGKVSSTVSYEDAGQTLVLDVTTNFAGGDQLTIADLGFHNFTGTTPFDNLELAVNGASGPSAATDDKTLRVYGPLSFSSAANQLFNQDDAATPMSLITLTEDATPSVTMANDLRIRIPATFNMTWDTTDMVATFGGPQAAKLDPNVSYENGGRTLVIPVVTDFGPGDSVTISGLSFTNFSAPSAADNLEMVDAGAAGPTKIEDANTIAIIDRYGILSAASQVFTVNDSTTASSLLTITEDGVTPTITDANNLRIRIPTGFNMTFDPTVLAVTIGGGASAKVSGTLLAYEDGNQTAVLDVTTDFAVTDQVTVSGLAFTSFSAISGPDNLELEVGNDDVVSSTAPQTITIVVPTLSAAANQFFTISDPVTATEVLTVTDSAVAPSITAADDIRIRIPAGISMTWDTADLTATIGGAALAKVSSTVSYEDAGHTLVLDVTADFSSSDQITIADLGFDNFSAASVADNLELVVDSAGGNTAALDDKTIRIVGPLSLFSAANQLFNQDAAAAPMSLLTLLEDGTPSITTANDLRIRIPATFNMTWDATDTVATIGGPEAANLDPNVSYEDGGRTLVIPVVTDFGPGDTVTISGLSFTSFSAPSAVDNLEMVDAGAGGPTKIEDANTITIFDRYGASSASDQIFTVNDFTTGSALITITEDANVATITAANDLRLRVPAGFNMLWDAAIPTVIIGGASSGKVTGTLLAYEDGGRTAVLDVTTDFAPQDQITVSGLAFTSFTATSATDNLEIEVGNDNVVSALDNRTVTIVAPTLSSAANQLFSFGDPLTAAEVMTVTDSAAGATINATDDIRVKIPAGFAMTWDTSDLTAIIGGAAAAKVSGTVSYEDAGQTLVLNVTTDFGAGDQVTIAGVGFDNFTGVVPADNLELVVSGLGGAAAVTDDKTIQILGPMALSSAVNQFFNEASPAQAISLITVTEDASPSLNTTDDLRIRIPATFNMTWDSTDTTAVIGGPQAAKLDTNVSYEDGDRTLVIPVLTDFGTAEQVTISGLSFANFVLTPADNLELVASGSGGGTAAEDDKTITIVERYGITSASNQVFVVDDPPTTAAVITITDDASSPTITAGNDLRIRIPAGFNATWDETVTGVPIGGTAAAKVSTLLFAYEDGGKTAVVDVLSDFVAGDQITVAGLRFIGLSTPSPIDNLELEVFNDDALSATDDKTITTIGGPNATLLSLADQLFFFNYPSTPVSPITVSDAAVPSITATNDIRIRIPAGFNMTWDSAITTATIGGVASGRVSTTVSYEDADATLVLDVTGDFVVGDYITLEDVNFTNFNSSASDNLKLLIDGGTSVVDEDRRTIAVFSLTLSADANQVFSVGAPPTSSVRFTITDDINLAMIKKKVELRIRIPASFPMFWDTTVESVSIGGIASDKMKTNLKEYEDSGKTLVLDVKDDFDEGDQITVDGLAFEDFASSAAPDFLLLDVGIPGITPRDDKTVEIIAGSASILSAHDQIFNVGSPSTPIATLTVSDAAAPLITKKKDLRIRIPAGFAMTWDTSITTATFGGTGASKLDANVTYEDVDHTLVVDVNADFAGGDWVIITDVNFTNSLHNMRLIAAAGQAHNGTDGTGVVLDGQDAGTTGVSVRDDYFYLESLELTAFRGADGAAAIDVQSASSVVLNRLLIYDFDDGAFDVSGIEAGPGTDVTVRNAILFGGDTGVRGTGADANVTLQNVTAFGMTGTGIFEDQATFDATNVISMNNALDFNIVNGSQTTTLSSDGSGTSIGVASTQFISIATGLEDLHLAATAVDAIDLGTDLSAQFGDDIDGNRRYSTWDLGAHEFAAATEVTLVSFAADALDGAVLLRWETSSELTNLGFNLYRATEEEGPYELVTTRLIPGLGTSMVGASYRYTDSELVNGTTYFYKLEDVETTGITAMHGPVSVMPYAGATEPPTEEAPGGSTSATSRITYGDPTNVSFRELERTDRYVVLELVTGGFYAVVQEDGSVELSVPTFYGETQPGEPQLPLKHAWVEAIAGKNVKIGKVTATQVEHFQSLRPTAARARCCFLD